MIDTKQSYQINVIKDQRGLVHLTQDQQHLVVNELFIFFQVTAHVLLQLITNLRTKTRNTRDLKSLKK